MNDTKANLRLPLFLAVVVLLGLVWSGIGPYDRLTWFLEVVPVLVAVPLLVWTARSFPLTPLAYVLIAVHALILMYLANVVFGTSIGTMMAPQFIDQPWSAAKVASVLEHLWVPVIVIGTSGTAGMIRRLRANLLDELHKQYVVTGRAKGLQAVTRKTRPWVLMGRFMA